MAKRLTLVPHVREVRIQGRPNHTQRYKRFATASTSTKVAMLPWRYDAELGTVNSLRTSA